MRSHRSMGAADRSRTAHRRRERPPPTPAPRAARQPAVQRLAWSRASPRSCSTDPASASRTGQPEAASVRATTKPSPPLLPGPHKTTVGRGDQRRVISRATASPACCMSSIPGMPDSTVRRSASSICATRSSAVGSAAEPLIGGAPHALRLGARRDHQLAEVSALQETEKRRRRVLQPVHDILSILDLPRLQPAATAVPKIGAPVLVTVGNDEAAQRDAFQQDGAHQLLRREVRFARARALRAPRYFRCTAR